MVNTITRTSDGKYTASVRIQDGIENLGLYDTFEKAQEAYVNAERAYNKTEVLPGADQSSRSLPGVVRPLVEALSFYAGHGNDNGEKARRALDIFQGLKVIVVLFALILFSGCTPAAPDGEPPFGPDVPEKVVPFNVTVQQMIADIPGHTLLVGPGTSNIWFFDTSDVIKLTLNGSPARRDKLDSAAMWQVATIDVTNPKQPQAHLNGTVVLIYQMVDGKWHLIEMEPYGFNEIKLKNK